MANRIPRYPTKPDSRGRIRIKFKGKTYRLPGAIGSNESLAEYARLLAEWSNATPRLASNANPLTISELVARFLRDDPRGLEHPQVKRIARACAPLERLFGPTFAGDFTAARLGAVQEAMISRSWQTPEEKALPAWGRDFINSNIKCIRSVFRWAEFCGLVRPGMWEHLRTCPPVSLRRPGVKLRKPRKPVDWVSQVEPILPLVRPQVAAMIQIQFFAGMRPGEVVAMTKREIDRNSEHSGVWLYRPSHHKTEHTGYELVKALGPKCQGILAYWLLITPDDDTPIFRPASNSKRPYGAEGYARAINRACRRAGVAAFCPYQLRHAARLRVTRSHGLDAARSHLGHVGMSMTVEYGKQLDLEMLAHVARECG